MSIVTLLADFPNYSARKVRRLAKQISFITSMQNEIGPVEPGIVRGIEQDLIEFNLLQAKTEEQLNDDIMHPTTEAIAEQVMKPVVKPFIWWGKETPLPDTLEEAHEWITSMLDDWKELAGNMGFEQFQDPEVLIERAKKAAPASPDHVTEFGGIAADAGNPAWWRGHDEACTILCQKVNAILDGNDDGRGVANDPWESTRRRLLALVAAPGDVEWRVKQLREAIEVEDSEAFGYASCGERAYSVRDNLLYIVGLIEAALRSQGQADAVAESELLALVAGPYMYHHKMDEAAMREARAFDRCRELTIQNIQTWCATRRAMTAALAQQAKLSLQESLPLDTPE